MHLQNAEAASTLSGLEFFCGIGGFAAVAREHGIAVTLAFDQDADARATYEHNFGWQPSGRTLDALDLHSLPPAALWWLSPPCTPFTRRGAQRDARDPRAVAFLRLIDAAARLDTARQPRFIVVENVAGFLGSEVHHRLGERWAAAGYSIRETVLCPTQFGIPMKRPRVFLAASAEGPAPSLEPPSPPLKIQPLAAFLDPAAAHDPALRLPAASIERYGPSLNVVDPASPSACTICFTSGYGKSWKAAGSFLPCPDGGLRRFSPEEILRLLGFPPGFEFPDSIGLIRRWHLAGNSLSLPCVRHILDGLRT